MIRCRKIRRRAAGGRSVVGARGGWWRTGLAQRESVIGQPLLDFLDRLRAETVDGQQVPLVAGRQRPDRVHAFAAEAVVRADGEIQLLDREARGVAGVLLPGDRTVPRRRGGGELAAGRRRGPGRRIGGLVVRGQLRGGVACGRLRGRAVCGRLRGRAVCGQLRGRAAGGQLRGQVRGELLDDLSPY